jgi:hypothetical protein
MAFRGQRGLGWLAPIVVFALVLVTACADSDGPSHLAPETTVREFTRATGGGCDVDACVQTTGWDVPVATPVGAEEVDLVVSVRFTYEVSESDGALAVVHLVLDGETRGTEMAPGEIRLAPTGGRNASTRLAWVEKDVLAEGRVHQVSFTLLPRDGDGNEQHSATALRGVVTVERL